MGVAVKWLDRKKTIVRYAFTDGWTWEELEAVAGKVDAMIESVPYRVDVILDFSNSLTEPPHQMLAHLRSGPLNSSKNWGGGVFVGISPFMRVILNTFMRIEPALSSRYAIAHTVKDARVLITQWRMKQPERDSTDI